VLFAGSPEAEVLKLHSVVHGSDSGFLEIYALQLSANLHRGGRRAAEPHSAQFEFTFLAAVLVALWLPF
jgi:hypothetical protein